MEQIINQINTTLKVNTNTIMKTHTLISLTKVNERIEHWKRLVELGKSNSDNPNTKVSIRNKQSNSTNSKLLNYWVGYKKLHYQE